MSDIICAKCGEPWDNYGLDHGDVEPDEAKKIRQGKGCPSCGFGTKCTGCWGKGTRWKDPWSYWSDEMVTCPDCGGTGKFNQEKEGDHLFESLESIIAASDEDPIKLIDEFRGFG